MDIAAEVAQKLLQIKAIKLSPQNPFTWASGIQSPIYCDNRKTLSYPSIRRFLAECFAEKSKAFGNINCIAGVATAGIAHGLLLAEELGLPFIYVRSKAKGHGMQNLIEGDIRGNERVLVVEDLISTGGSCLKAVEALEDYGCHVAGVLAIFTYGFTKAEKAFEEAECAFDTLSNYDALIQRAVEIEYIQEDQVEFLKNWRAEVG
ncbi:MAG: orotate phosphoribosyltransferase [Bacteroidota bacterium]